MKIQLFKKIKKQKPEPTPLLPKTPDNPLFYCTLCSRFIEYHTLIDGYKCCFCDNEYFLVTWKEFKEIFHPAPPVTKKTRKKLKKFVDPWEKISVN